VSRKENNQFVAVKKMLFLR